MSRTKKIGLLVFILLATCRAGYSQFSFGIKGGATHAFFRQDFGNHPGYLAPRAGIFGDYLIGASLGFTANVGYAQYRGSLDATPVVNSTSILIRSNTFSLHLVEVSGLAYYKLPLSILGTAIMSVGAGGAAGYNFYTSKRVKNTYFNQGGSLATSGTENVTSSFNPFLYFAIGGLKIEFPLEGKLSAIVFEVQYHHAFNEVLVVSGFPSYTNGRPADIRLTSLSTQIGIKF
jgi:hypothetical protein